MTEMIQIRQLVWQPYLTGFEARSIMGLFRVFQGHWRIDDNLWFEDVGLVCRDNETAKAAAQAWFEAQIRNQLLPHPLDFK